MRERRIKGFKCTDARQHVSQQAGCSVQGKCKCSYPLLRSLCGCGFCPTPYFSLSALWPDGELTATCCYWATRFMPIANTSAVWSCCG